MRGISAEELSRMRDTAESSFFDSCQLGAPTSPGWGGDPGGTTYVYGAEIACGFDAAPAGETNDGAQVPLVDAKLRLPVDTTITEKYRVQMTKRHGEALSPVEYYWLDGPPRRGPSALVCDLKRMTGSSAK